MKVENILISDRKQIKNLLFGINAYKFAAHERMEYQKFKKFIEGQFIIFNWDMYPITYINHDIAGSFLKYLELSGAHDIVYLAQIDTSKISKEDFINWYYPCFSGVGVVMQNEKEGEAHNVSIKLYKE